ncbi:hypothetical protein TUBRATIS_25420 [Tubulinosema ratisbonensis]|uniref:Uncharacterized protein n=1 Tax=Tubulinosema ratisbonensis TaxID=291195 RepID=A0A437AIN3_9MICR|nr:hypothetical protein TUBRATIS_25420 [Tubulinosema ratisbonensis]
MSFKVIWALFIRLASYWFRNLLSFGLILFIVIAAIALYFMHELIKDTLSIDLKKTNLHDTSMKALFPFMYFFTVYALNCSLIGQRIHSYSLQNHRLINTEIRNNTYGPVELVCSILLFIFFIFFFLFLLFSSFFFDVRNFYIHKTFTLAFPLVIVFSIWSSLFYYNLGGFSGIFTLLLTCFNLLRLATLGSKGKKGHVTAFSKIDIEKYRKTIDTISFTITFLPFNLYNVICVRYFIKLFIVSLLNSFVPDAAEKFSFKNFVVILSFVNLKKEYFSDYTYKNFILPIILVLVFLVLIVLNMLRRLKKSYSQPYRYKLALN